MLGCDFHCGYCQNWVTSQALRDPAAGAPVVGRSASVVSVAVVAGIVGGVVATVFWWMLGGL